MNLEAVKRFFPTAFSLVAMIYIAFWLAVLVGWGLNISNILSAINLPLTKMFVLQVVGVFFFPLGAILGYAV